MAQQQGGDSIFQSYTITVVSSLRSYTDKERAEAPNYSNIFFQQAGQSKVLCLMYLWQQSPPGQLVGLLSFRLFGVMFLRMRRASKMRRRDRAIYLYNIVSIIMIKIQCLRIKSDIIRL